MTPHSQRILFLENALAAAADDLRELIRYRRNAHEYDRDMGNDERHFADEEDWKNLETIAAKARAEALKKLRP